MDGLRIRSGAPQTLWSFNTKEDLKHYKIGCDQENGGNSTVHLDLEESPSINAPIERNVTGKFWGEMRLDVKPSSRLNRGGFAMFRNKVRMLPSS
jgi:NADH dehydrogenase [ubiquinone] 1 alpha subcomplex assembly factor 1